MLTLALYTKGMTPAKHLQRVDFPVPLAPTMRVLDCGVKAPRSGYDIKALVKSTVPPKNLRQVSKILIIFLTLLEILKKL